MSAAFQCCFAATYDQAVTDLTGGTCKETCEAASYSRKAPPSDDKAENGAARDVGGLEARDDAVLAERLVQGLRQGGRLQGCEDQGVADDLRHLDAEQGQRRCHLETDEAPTGNDRGATLAGAPPQLER